MRVAFPEQTLVMIYQESDRVLSGYSEQPGKDGPWMTEPEHKACVDESPWKAAASAKSDWSELQ